MRARTTSSSSRRRDSASFLRRGPEPRSGSRKETVRRARPYENNRSIAAAHSAPLWFFRVRSTTSPSACYKPDRGSSEGKRHGKTGNQAEGGRAGGAVQVVQAWRQQ